MSVRKPSILHITSQMPWPLNTGGHLRTCHLLRNLAQDFNITVVTAHDEDRCGARALADFGIRTRVVQKQRSCTGEALQALHCALTGRPYVMFARHDHPEMRTAIQNEIREHRPDIVWLDHLDAFVYQPDIANIKTVIDLHNIYSMIADRIAEERGFPVSSYLRREARLLKSIEHKAAQSTNVLLTVSEEERRHFESLGAASTWLVPNGVDGRHYSTLPVGREDGPPVIIHMGSMSWEPNVESAEFLANVVMPALRQQIPDAKLQIVGRSPVARVQALHGKPGIEVTGTVPDVMPYLRAATLLAVPLSSGGGTRLKILEAFAAGLPVVSTAVGCEGIAGSPGVHYEAAERDQFANSLANLLIDRRRGTDMAHAARQLATLTYDWTAVSAIARRAVLSLTANVSRHALASG